MCVWLLNWPIQRLQNMQPELRSRPLVLYAAVRGKMVVTAVSQEARRRGVVPGMSLAEANALLWTAERGPTCLTPHASRPTILPGDPQADREALRKLAVWCQRFSPTVALEEAEHPHSLLLDMTGCAHLFGGETALAEQLIDAFRRHGYVTRAAIADTIGAAWAVAHYGREVSGEWLVVSSHYSPLTTHHYSSKPVVVPPTEQAPALSSLAVAALRLSADVRELLDQFDIRRISQLLALPRADLPSRFGFEVMHRLDQALGKIPELLIPERPPEDVETSWTFDPPVSDRRIIETVFQHLLEQLLERLRPAQMGIQQLHCSLRTIAGSPIHFQVSLLQSSLAVQHLMEMVRLHGERIHVPGEVSAVAMRIVVAAPLEFHQARIFDEDPGQDRSKQFRVLIERLSNRLGEKAILRPRLRPDSQPEFAWHYEPWSASRGAWGVAPEVRNQKSEIRDQAPCPLTFDFCPLTSLLRPPLLKPRPLIISVVSIVPGGPPLRFQWEGRSYLVSRYWGPERIETGWWRGVDVRRDYYHVETSTGERFWLFRTVADESWFLHGVFA